MVLQILERLVIYVDDGLLSHQIVLPIFDSLYQAIEILFVGRLVEDRPMKYFTTVCRPSMFLPAIDHTAHNSQQWVTPELGLKLHLGKRNPKPG
jgi:hypothetical protein